MLIPMFSWVMFYAVCDIIQSVYSVIDIYAKYHGVSTCVYNRSPMDAVERLGWESLIDVPGLI